MQPSQLILYMYTGWLLSKSSMYVCIDDAIFFMGAEATIAFVFAFNRVCSSSACIITA